MHFFFRNRQMLHASRYNRELTCFQSYIAIMQFDHQSSLHDKEQFILVLMAVPDKLTLELCQLNIRVVQLACNLWAPILMKERKFLVEVHFVHESCLP